MISPAMSAVLRWTLPPLLGAMIGYVTNAIAIRMLFRPLREWCVLGLRVPLTPGVIPRQRDALAHSIGQMVSEHLITTETVKEHLAGDSFRAGLRGSVEAATRGFLESSTDSLSLSSSAFLGESFTNVAGGLLGGFLRSGAFLSAARTLVSRLVGYAGSWELARIASAERAKRFILNRLRPLLSSEHGRLAERARSWVARHLRENTSLALLLPEELIDGLIGGLRTAFPTLRESLIRWLRTPGVRQEIEIRGRFLVKDILERLNTLQKFFVSVGQYDRTLDEKMPEIVNDAVDYMEELLGDPQVASRLLRSLRTGLMGLRERGLADVVGPMGVDLPGGLARLVQAALVRLQAGRLDASLERAIDRFYDGNGARALREIGARYLGLQEQEVVEAITVGVLGYLTRPEAGDAIARNLMEFAAGVTSRDSRTPISELLGVNQQRKGELDGFLFERLQLLLAARLPGFVQGFDVRGMVVDRINRLDVAQVETLLMMVIARHLKWINIFGALLGGLIGGGQALLSHFL